MMAPHSPMNGGVVPPVMGMQNGKEDVGVLRGSPRFERVKRAPVPILMKEALNNNNGMHHLGQSPQQPVNGGRMMMMPMQPVMMSSPPIMAMRPVPNMEELMEVCTSVNYSQWNYPYFIYFFWFLS